MTARRSRRRRSRGSLRVGALVFTLETAKDLPYVVTWFANAALKYGINKPIEAVDKGLSRDELETLIDFYEEHIEKVIAEQSKKRGRNATRETVCRDWLPLTGNDKRGSFDPCRAVNMLKDLLRGERAEPAPLPPALSLEFTEHIRPPVLRPLKREVVFIDSVMQALVSLGAFVTYVYNVQRGDSREWGYVYVDTELTSLDDYRSLHEKCKNVVSSVTRNEGSRLVMLVGLAAAVALVFGALRREAGVFVDSLRLTMTARRRAGGKVMLKAFERIELLGLAETLAKIRIPRAVYELARKYPGRERREERIVRSFVERIAKAIVVYHSLGSKHIEDFYSVLRSLSGGRDAILYRAGQLVYGEAWERIVDDLLSASV